MTDIKHTSNKTASGHTPGPWAIADGPKLCISAQGRTRFVASISYGFGASSDDDIKHSEAEANARLIAAAPELLTSLQEVVRICEAMRYTTGLGKNQLERIERAKAVIAEAKALVA